jgi:hypothetical protein
VRRPLIALLYQPRTIDDDECRAVGGIRISRGNRSTRRKHATVPCPSKIPHELTWARTQAAEELVAYYMLVSCFAYSTNLKMEAMSTTETSANFHWIALRYVPEGRPVHNHRCEKLRSNYVVLYLQSDTRALG